MQKPEHDRDVKRPTQGPLHGIGGHDVHPLRKPCLVYIALRDGCHRRQLDDGCLQLGTGVCDGEREAA